MILDKALEGEIVVPTIRNKQVCSCLFVSEVDGVKKYK